MDSFATLIKKARQASHLRRADVAAQILKTNGRPISSTYLAGMEQGKWAPPARAVSQFAQVLKLPEDLLYFALGFLPPDIQEMGATHQQIVSAFEILRQIPTNSNSSPEDRADKIQGVEGWIGRIGARADKLAVARPIRPGGVNSFAALIKKARLASHLSRDEVANQILKTDGQPLSYQYLSKFEQGEYTPPARMIPQFAQVLKLPEDVLYFALGLLPPDLNEIGATYQQVVEALASLRHCLLDSYRAPGAQVDEIEGADDGTDKRGTHTEHQAIAKLIGPVMAYLGPSTELGLETQELLMEQSTPLATLLANKMDGFATLIKAARQASHLRQEDVVKQVLHTDGQPITIFYLSRLEHGKFKPSARLIPQLAQALKLPKDLLYFTIGLLPPYINETEATHQQIADALANLRQTLTFSHQGLDEQAG